MKKQLFLLYSLIRKLTVPAQAAFKNITRPR